jgi:cytosine/adenosine deaminase-related metal-dependent hydrolase
MGPRLVLTAKVILTQHRAKPVMDGFVLIGDHRILQVGERRDLRFLPTVRLIDLGDTLLLPGLINAHCHLDYTALKGRVPHKGHFREWLTAMAAQTRRISRSDVRQSILEGIRESLALGTTTICDVSTRYESYGILKKEGLRAQVFFECLDFGSPDALGIWKRAIEKNRHATALPPHPSTLQWGLSPHTPFTVSNELFHQMGRFVQQHPQIPTAIHVAESREERDYFASGKGPIARRVRELCPERSRPDARTSVQFLSKRGWLPKLDMAIHCNMVDAKDLDLLARHRIAVVHCPGSHEFFGHPLFKYREFKRRGIKVCLGTDSLASNSSLSMFREMRLFKRAHPEVSGSEILSLTTQRAAQAIGMGKELGQVRPGFLADLIGIPAPDKRIGLDAEECAAWVLRHQGEVSFSMVNGEMKMRLLRR